MIHAKRRFCIADIGSAYELARMLSQHTMTLCSGFRYKGYLFLNDSFSEDGAAEYAIVREEDGVQVESITFGWCDEDEALKYIRDAVGGAEGYELAKVKVLEHERGESCRLCA